MKIRNDIYFWLSILFLSSNFLLLIYMYVYHYEIDFDPSFLGALFGAIITGSIAISIFAFVVYTRKHNEEKEIKRVNLSNLIKLQFINNQVIYFLKYFAKEFSEKYTEEKEFKFKAYIKDMEWLKEETKKLDTTLLSDKLLVDYLTYYRILSSLYSEISLFPELPLIQREANIGGLVTHAAEVKRDFDNFEKYVEVLIKQSSIK